MGLFDIVTIVTITLAVGTAADYLAKTLVYDTELYQDAVRRISRSDAYREWARPVTAAVGPPPRTAQPHPDSLAARSRHHARAVEKKKAELSGGTKSARRSKELQSLESALAADRQQLGGLSLRAMLLSTGSSLVTFWLLRAAYAGVVVATLPFTPFALFKMMTHQGLPGDDYTQASYMMFFVLTNMALKPVLARALKLEAPKVGGAGALDWSKMFNMPTDARASQ